MMFKFYDLLNKDGSKVKCVVFLEEIDPVTGSKYYTSHFQGIYIPNIS